MPSATSARLPKKCKPVGIRICSLVGNRGTGGNWEYEGGVKGRSRKKRACVHKCWAGEFDEEMRNMQTETTYRKRGKKEQTEDCVAVPSVLGEEEAHGRYGEGLTVRKVCEGECWYVKDGKIYRLALWGNVHNWQGQRNRSPLGKLSVATCNLTFF